MARLHPRSTKCPSFYAHRPRSPQITPLPISQSWRRGLRIRERGLWGHRKILGTMLSPPASGLCRQCQLQHVDAAWEATDAMRSGPATGIDAFASGSRGQPSSYRFLSCYVQPAPYAVHRPGSSPTGDTTGAEKHPGRIFRHCMHASASAGLRLPPLASACLRCRLRTIEGLLLYDRPDPIRR